MKRNTTPNHLCSPSQCVLSLLTVLCLTLLAGVDSPTQAKNKEPAKATAPNPQVDGGELDDDEILGTSTVEQEVAVTLDPMEMRFKVLKIERGLSRDSRRFDAPRIVTMMVLDNVGELNESKWRGKRLAVFHKVPIDLGNGTKAFNQVKVGEVRIKSVFQSTLQAQVVEDDLTKSMVERKGRLGVNEPRVVMIGDTARLEKPIVAPVKTKKRRVIKAKKRSKYERKEMKWKL
jgi:hypothetical protein